ncbi:hypothetical protein CLOM_g12361 [Closterium sp. NIES-68]|nr:hypothetical protein CLOM_g12361 [Closterium sp. NIES-68]GJP80617.1 hypothetical protein CLOP_g10819 [Closterium sp. NIES-67]
MRLLYFLLAALPFLLCYSSRAASQVLDAPGGAIGGDGGIERAMSLYRAWEDIYGLKPAKHLPPANVSLPPNVPPAPHLEDCAARTAFRQAAEQRGANGEPPAWTRPSNCCGCNPQPPWVRGSDAGNLALTRVVQRDLWEHQFPASCAGKRLLIVDWPKPLPADAAAADGAAAAAGAAGVASTGSDLPLLLQWAAAALGLAVRFNRVLVFRGAFPPAKHGQCNDLSAPAALHCYFLASVSQDCERAALDAAAASTSTVPPCVDMGAGGEGGAEGEAVMKGQEAVVCVKGGSLGVVRGADLLGRQAGAADRWGKAYQQRASLLEVEGVLRNDDATLKAYWWQAQAVRFLLRWPSGYLCHATNRMRHSAYGLRVATHLLLSHAQQSAIIRNVANPDGTPENINKINGSEEAVALARLNFTSPPNLHVRAWPGEGFAGCAAAEGLSGKVEEDEAFVKSAVGRTRTIVNSDYEGVGGEVYVMRPIVSVQLALSGDRGGGGGGVGVASGELVGEERWGVMLSAVMGFVHRLRLIVPDMRYVWLSTLAQSVIEESHHHPDWTFIFSQNARLQRDHAFSDYEKAVGLPEVTSSRLATLLIASEGDFFVGAKGSAWHGLMNGLRATNGRVFAGHVTLDLEEQ